MYAQQRASCSVGAALVTLLLKAHLGSLVDGQLLGAACCQPAP